jgi:hypothetical protein
VARRGIEKRFAFFGLGPTLTVAISFDRFMARAANRRKLRVVISFQHRLAVAEMMHFCRAITASDAQLLSSPEYSAPDFPPQRAVKVFGEIIPVSDFDCQHRPLHQIIAGKAKRT